MKWVNGNVPIIQWEFIGWHWNLIDHILAGIFQQMFTCSKSIIETLEKGVKFVQC